MADAAVAANARAAAAESRATASDQRLSQLQDDLPQIIQRMVADPAFKAPGVASAHDLRRVCAIPADPDIIDALKDRKTLPFCWPSIKSENAKALIILDSERTLLEQTLPMYGVDFPDTPTKMSDSEQARVDKSKDSANLKRIFRSATGRQRGALEQMQRMLFSAAQLESVIRDISALPDAEHVVPQLELVATCDSGQRFAHVSDWELTFETTPPRLSSSPS